MYYSVVTPFSFFYYVGSWFQHHSSILFFFFVTNLKTLKRLFFLIAIFLFAFDSYFALLKYIYYIRSFATLSWLLLWVKAIIHWQDVYLSFLLSSSPFTVYDAYRREPSQIFFGGVLISVQARVALFYWRILWGELHSLSFYQQIYDVDDQWCILLMPLSSHFQDSGHTTFWYYLHTSDETWRAIWRCPCLTESNVCECCTKSN